MGLGDFIGGIKDAAVNVGKGAIWAARPDHWDDIAEGVGKGAEFVVENPGKALHIAGEVGKAVIKDQLDPVNLAINAGLLAATVATGGAAAPAFIAKLGLGAKSIEAGIEGAKIADTAVDIAKGVQSGVKAVEAGGAAVKGAKAVETVAEGTKALKSGAKGVQAVEEGTQALSKGGKLMKYVDKGLGLEPGKFGTKASNLLNPLENSSKLGMSAARERAAGRILEAGGEAPSFARQATAALVQGGGHGAGGPAQLAGMSDKVYAAQKMAARAGAVGKRLDQAGQLSRGVEVAADPMKAVEGQVDKQAGPGSGYTDYGQTKTDMYGGGQQLAIGQGSSQTTPNMYASAGGSPPPGGGGPGGAGPGGPPPGGGSPPGLPPGGPPGGGWNNTMPPSQVSTTSTSSQTQQRVGGVSKTKGGGKKGFGGDTRQHIWEGPRSQWAGGVASNYDWRTIDPLRKAAPMAGKRLGPSLVQQWEPLQKKNRTAGEEATAPGTGVELNEMGAPSNFSPEVDKGGGFAMSQGQNPIGSEMPKMLDAAPKSYTATNVRTAAQPIGAIGPGPNKTGKGIIDVDSSSPDDYKFDQAGQGYFDFANMGSGAADIGQQPNTSPMYQQGSRTSRRGIGPGTLGV